MSYSPADLEAIAKKLRMDLTNAQVKLTELMNGYAELSRQLPDQGEKSRCPQCGLEIRGKTVAEHLADVHAVAVLETAEQYAAAVPSPTERAEASRS